jgi:uncharacterized membrane protein YagU involved in acid resistance
MSDMVHRTLMGGIAGIAGTLTMTVAMRAMHRHLPAPQRYPLPPREIIEGTIAPTPSARSDQPRRDTALLSHLGYGAATGALYAVLKPQAGIASGVTYGVLVWGVSYLGLFPALRVLHPATRHPLRRNSLMIAAHLVWGATLAATLRELEAAEIEIFSQGPTPDVLRDG